MNATTDASVRRILAFGDSNTYGWMPVENGPPSRRFPADVRWPGAMRCALGSGYEVIEEGLNGRTTDQPDPTEPRITGAGLDGAAALPGVLASHLPIDLLIIMLGTNDLKAMFARSPLRVALGAGRLIDIARCIDGGVATDYPPPAILLVAPPPLGPQTCFREMFEGGEEKSRHLGRLFEGMARLADVAFFDAARVIRTDGIDGLHLSAAAHQALGRALAAKAKSILQAVQATE